MALLPANSNRDYVIIAAAGGGRGTCLPVRHKENWSRKVRSLQYQAAEGGGMQLHMHMHEGN